MAANDGFTQYEYNPAQAGNYWVTGADCQILTVSLHTGEELQTEPGTFMHMSPNMKTDVTCQPCNCARICAGESCIMLHFKGGEGTGYVAVTPNFPAKVVPVDLAAMSGSLTTRQGAYMSSLGQVDIDYDCDCNCIRCCCGGMGCVRQKLKGTGTAFLAAGGTILQKQLGPGERILVDTGSLLGWSEGVGFDVQRTGGCLACCCGGEGMYFAQMTGPGTVYIESMSFFKYKLALAPEVQEVNR